MASAVDSAATKMMPRISCKKTMLEAFRSWHTFRGDSKVTTWLYRIADENMPTNAQPEGSTAPGELPTDDVLLEQNELAWLDASDGFTPLANTIKIETQFRLEQAIAELPMDYRMPLVLKELVGFSGPEIADITGMNETTVRVRVHRARLALRKSIVARPAYTRFERTVQGKHLSRHPRGQARGHGSRGRLRNTSRVC